MEIPHPETEMMRVARNSTRLRLALEHEHARHPEPAKLDRGREPGWAPADDSDVGVGAHRGVPRSSATSRPVAPARRRVTAARQ